MLFRSLRMENALAKSEVRKAGTGDEKENRECEDEASLRNLVEIGNEEDESSRSPGMDFYKHHIGPKWKGPKPLGPVKRPNKVLAHISLGKKNPKDSPKL